MGKVSKSNIEVSLQESKNQIKKALNNPNLSEDQQIKLADLVVELSKTINELKISNNDYREKAETQLRIMNRAKDIIEEKDKTISILNKQTGTRVKGNKELLDLYNNLNQEVSINVKEACKRKYADYENEWMSKLAPDGFYSAGGAAKKGNSYANPRKR